MGYADRVAAEAASSSASQSSANQADGGFPASKWMLEQAETGQLPVAWRFSARRAALVAAMAQAYGHPVPLVAAAWRRAFPSLAVDGNLNAGLP